MPKDKENFEHLKILVNEAGYDGVAPGRLLENRPKLRTLAKDLSDEDREEIAQIHRLGKLKRSVFEATRVGIKLDLDALEQKNGWAAKFTADLKHQQLKATGAIPGIDPELYDHDKVSFKSEIYTLGNDLEKSNEPLRGGFGAVYRGRDIDLKIDVAIKIQKSHWFQMLKREAQYGAQIDSRHLVYVHRVGRLDPDVISPELARKFRPELKQLGCTSPYESPGEGRRYIVMKWIDGDTLKKYTDADPPPSEERIRGWMQQCCKGMRALEHRDIIHRDLKPANLFLTKDDDGKDLLKIGDLGLAKQPPGGELDDSQAAPVSKGDQKEGLPLTFSEGNLTNTSASATFNKAGSPPYMSPEHFDGECTKQSDIYSYGATFYHLLTGKFPISARDWAGFQKKHNTATPRPPKKLNPEISDEINDLIMRCLKKDPPERWETWKEICEKLTSLISLPEQIRQAEEILTDADIEGPEKEKHLNKFRQKLLVTETEKQRWITALRDDLLFHGEGDFDSAIRKYSKLVELNPSDVDSLVSRGAAYAQKKEYDKAIQDYNAAIQLDRENAEIWSGRGLVHLFMGNSHQAIENLDEAIQLAPEEARYRNFRGRAYAKKEEFDQAIENYSAAIDINSNDWSSWFDQGVAYANKEEFDKAILNFNEAIQLGQRVAFDGKSKESEAGIWFYRGRAYLDKGKLGDAIENLKMAIELDPENFTVRKYLFRTYVQADDIDQAIESFEDWIRIEPKNPIVWNWRGVAYADKGEFDKAIDCFDQAIQLNPESADAYNNRGWSFVKIGDFDKVIENSDEAIRLAPEDADAWHTRGFAYAQKGEPDKAIENYDKAIQLNPEEGRFWYSRGVSHQETGNKAAAKTDFEKATELDYYIESEEG